MTSKDNHSGKKPQSELATDQLRKSIKTYHSPLISDAERAIRASELGNAVTASQRLHQEVERMLETCKGVDWKPVLENVHHFGQAYQQFLKSPEFAVIGETLRLLNDSSLLSAVRQAGMIGSIIQERFADFRPVLLEMANSRNRLAGLVKLQAIGDLIRHPDSYSQSMVIAMRDELGDWRDPITFRDDPSVYARKDRYRDHGFDADLVDVPDENFGEVVDTTGIRQPAVMLEEVFGAFAPRPLISGLPEGELSRQAYKWLFLLEAGIRRLIAHLMEEAFGPKWPRHRLPNGMHEAWMEKQQRSVQAGRPQCPIIEYADFTDYQKIIERRDNWDQVFSSLWYRKEDVRESLQRIHWVRIETMHARPLLKQDILTVYIEGQRLLQSARKVWSDRS